MQLTKGMYGTQFMATRGGPFGLECGQMHGLRKITHNSGWYNKLGEKLGWGDLSADDFRRIAAELPEGELFIVLGEHDSFWNFVVRNPGIIGSMCATTPTVEAPGVQYVAEKCCYIIAAGKLYWVHDRPEYLEVKDGIATNEGIAFTVIPHDAAKQIIAEVPK